MDDPARLFAPEPTVMIVQMRWEQGRGWRLFVAAWDPLDAATERQEARYGPLSASEAVDVVMAEISTRLPWTSL